MPQLDITAYSTQLFWVFIMLSLIYLVIDLYVLPHILRSLRLRARILDSINKTAKSDNSSLEKELHASVSSFVDASHKIADYKLALMSLYDDKKGLLLNKLNSLFFKRDLAAFASAISYIKQTKQNNSQTRSIGIFAALFSLSDEFILMFCFATFALIFTFATKTYLKDTIDGKILEIKTRFFGPLELKLANLNAKTDLLKKLSLLTKDKRKFSARLISDLDKYTRISDQKYFDIKVRAYFADIQSTNQSYEISSIRRILATYFKRPSKANFRYIDKNLTPINIANNAKMLDRLLAEMLRDNSHPSTTGRTFKN